MYKLFIGFRKLGEFSTILEAKQFASKSGLTGTFCLIGDNYHDCWYVPDLNSLKNQNSYSGSFSARFFSRESERKKRSKRPKV